jgi:hypothetical protein
MPIPLRPDHDAARIRLAARDSKDANEVRRLLALASIYDGATRAAAAEIGGVTRQIVRDWVLRFNASGPQGLVDRKAPGQPSLLKDTHRAALTAVIDSGPIPAIHGGPLAHHRPVPMAVGRVPDQRLQANPRARTAPDRLS